MATIVVNDIEVEVGAKENLVQAAQRAGIEIPHYCWHPSLSVVASCRMCLVEVGEKSHDGTITMLPRLMPACQTAARSNIVVRTNTEKVKKAQSQTLEYLLLNHPLDCSICDQAGECYLQDYTYKFGNAQSRLNEPKVQRLDKYHIGQQIALFTDRCVMCTRCVRFTREISGTSELQVVNRGSVEEIDVFPGNPCDNKLAGNVVDLCPVGALCSKDFLYKKRVWWLKTQNSVCQGCSTGCSIHIDQEKDRLYRLRPRENPLAQGSFMCDDGRFGWKYIESGNRLLAPRIGRLRDVKSTGERSSARELAATNMSGSHWSGSSSVQQVAAESSNEHIAVNELSRTDPWPATLDATRHAIDQIVAKSPERFVAVLSPMMFCEEAFLLAKYFESLSQKIMLALGPVPIVGEDDLYPKRSNGSPPAAGNAKFAIRAEKCPNRLGVQWVLKHFQREVISFESVVGRLDDRSLSGIYIVGGYPGPWLDDSLLRKFEGLSTLIVQDLLISPLTDMATILLASASFVERHGTVVNYAGLAQEVHQAIRGPADVRSDGRLIFELSQRVGLYDAKAIRQEMAREIPALAGLSSELGSRGIQLLPCDEGTSVHA